MDKVGLEAGLRKFLRDAVSVINFLSPIEYSRGITRFFVSCGRWDLMNLLFYTNVENFHFWLEYSNIDLRRALDGID